MKNSEEINSLQLESWLSQIGQKDAASFRRLHDATYSTMFSVVLRIVRRREIAEEILQEGFMSIWLSAGSYQNNISTPMAWISTVMRNKGYDAHRRNDRSIQFTEMDVNDDSLNHNFVNSVNVAALDDILQVRCDAKTLVRGMSVLNRLQRQAIGLTYYGDLPHSEVAARLDRSVGTVKTTVRRGLLKMRAHLENRLS